MKFALKRKMGLEDFPIFRDSRSVIRDDATLIHFNFVFRAIYPRISGGHVSIALIWTYAASAAEFGLARASVLGNSRLFAGRRTERQYNI